MDEIQHDLPEAGGVDRRTLIRGAGLVGAAAWAVPMVTSVTAHAYAASTSGCSFPAGGDACFDQTECGNGCYCNQNADGKSAYCTEPTDCTNPVCASDADCGRGEVCQASCCGDLRCFAPCGTAPKAAPLAGRADTGRSSAPRR